MTKPGLNGLKEGIAAKLEDALNPQKTDMSDQEFKIKIVADADTSGFKATSKAAEDLNREMGVINVSQEDINKATQKGTEAFKEDAAETERLTIKKAELREAINSLTNGFPRLAEVARSVLNPIVFLVAAPIAAFEIFKSRIDAAKEALSQTEMPDLTSGIEQAKQLREQWEGIAEAIQKANQNFNSPENVYSRDTAKIDHELEATKKLLEIAKATALANLETKKGAMSPADYSINKAVIENSYLARERKVEQDAEDRKLAARYNERLNAQKQSEKAASQAGSIKLPESDADFQAQQDALKQRMGARKADQDKFQAELDKINEAKQAIGEGNFFQRFKAGYGLYWKYGSDAEHADDIIGDQVKRAKEDQANIAKEIARRQKLFDRRNQLRADASTYAGQAEDVGLELPGEREAWERSKNVNNFVAQRQQQINAHQAAAEIAASGADFKNAVQVLQTALATRDQFIIAEISKLAAHIRIHSAQIGAGSFNTVR